MGLCFANVVDGICKASLKKMDTVRQPECCCTGGGQAWGPNCAACPAVGSGIFQIMHCTFKLRPQFKRVLYGDRYIV